MSSLYSTTPATIEVKAVITIPIRNEKLLSKNNGTHSQAIIPVINIGNITYNPKTFIKSSSKKIFILATPNLFYFTIL